MLNGKKITFLLTKLALKSWEGSE